MGNDFSVLWIHNDGFLLVMLMVAFDVAVSVDRGCLWVGMHIDATGERRLVGSRSV